MGTYAVFCLKIIACGSDSAVEDDVEAPEAKGSGEKRGWSFRKRSSRHRVLNNTTSENVTLGNKETSQSSTLESQTPAGPAIQEKVLALVQPDEKCQPPASFELKPPKLIEPELSEASDPPKPFETEVSKTLHAPQQPELLEPEESETLHASKQTDLFGTEVPESVDASESPELVEPETYVSVGESKSLNLDEQEVYEILSAAVLESSEPVEPKTRVSVGESESLNLEPEVPETVVASAIEPPQPVESKIIVGVVPESPVTTELKQSETVVSSRDDILEEPIVIIIQTGVRGFLAQRELVKLRSTVKLQAAIRGHLVRRQAVDTLYCMQGIVKVQSLVRAHQSMLLGNGMSVNKPTTTKSSTEKLLTNAFSRQLLESTPKSKSTIIKCDPLKPNPAWTWLEKWMAVFSSGLADSETPEVIAEDVQFQAEKISPVVECENVSKVSESIIPEFAVKEASRTLENEKSSISCDPAEEYQPSNLLSGEENMEQSYYDSSNASFKDPSRVVAQNDQSIQSDPHSQTQSVSLSHDLAVEIEEPKLSTKRMASEFAVKEASRTLENEKSSISCDPAEEYQPSNLLSSEENMEQPYYDSSNASFKDPSRVAAQNDQSIQSDPHSQTQSVSLSHDLAVEIEEPKLSTKRVASEEVDDVENTKFAYGSRKASNPAFIAAHSKFEELSSSASGASLKSPRQDASVESHPNTVSSLEESVLEEKEPSSSEAFIPDETRVNMGGSECGTELSVTSALDSPDRSEAGVAEMDLEVKYVKEEASYPISSENLGVKANGHSVVNDSNSSSFALFQKEFHESNGVPKPVVAAESNQPEQKPHAIASDEHDNGEYVVLDMAADSPQVEPNPERSASDLKVEVGSHAEHPAYKLSPDATPKDSHMTIAESQGTPSSQVSVKNNSKVDKSRSTTKHGSHSAGKKTVAKPLLDSGVRSSGEQLSKDQKSGKRRNSFGSTKSDNVDQEPRDSTGSIKALPSYMQATESAKAKANSPRSSPDVHDKDTLILKKRHSLPGAGGRQGSPRVQPPTSQSPQPQAVKGNVSTPPQERKWQR